MIKSIAQGAQNPHDFQAIVPLLVMTGGLSLLRNRLNRSGPANSSE